MKLSYNVYVMTYGSLMNGYHNHQFMENAKGTYVGKAKSIEANYDMISMHGSFPAIIPGNKRFTGELYSVPMEGVVNSLDFLEGYPDFYDRVPIKVECNGQEYNAIVYVLSKGALKSYNLTNKTKVFESDGYYTWLK